MKRTAFLFGVFLCIAGTAQADVTWNAEPVDSNFANAANWSANPVDQIAYFENANAPEASLSSALSLNRLFIAHNANTLGTLNITNGGELTVASLFYIGAKGSGKLNITGGTINAKGEIYTADQTSGTAEVTISNAVMNMSASTTFGCRGTAVLNVEDGAVMNFNGIGRHWVGRISGTSTMNISGGEVNYKNDGANYAANALWYIGEGTKGIVNITGGTVNGYQAYLADGAGGNAEFNLSGGSVTMKDAFIVGTRGKAVVNISGGSFSGKSIYASYGADTNSNATVNQSGGTVTLTSGIFYGSQAYKAVGTYNLSGGKLTAPTVKYGNTNTTAQFNISGTGEAVISGAVEVPTTLSGGTLTAGSITNTLTHSAGVLAPGGEGAYGTTTITGTYLSAIDSGTNIALGQPASQSSNHIYGSYPASCAVDDNMSNFTHSNGRLGTTQWWQVMVSEEPISIESAKVYNRTLDSSTTKRLVDEGSGFHFELYSGTLENPGEMLERTETYYADTWTQGEEQLLNFQNEGNILRIVRDFPEDFSLSGDECALSLAEVQVFTNGAEIQMDLKSDASEFDKILIDGGSMDVSHVNLDLTIDDLLNVASGTEWELFSMVNDGTLVGDFASISLNDMALTDGWAFANGILSYNAADSQVPEPGTMVLLALGIGGLLIMRRKH